MKIRTLPAVLAVVLLERSLLQRQTNHRNHHVQGLNKVTTAVNMWTARSMAATSRQLLVLTQTLFRGACMIQKSATINSYTIWSMGESTFHTNQAYRKTKLIN